jgi:hypothetical protein
MSTTLYSILLCVITVDQVSCLEGVLAVLATSSGQLQG